MEKEQESSSVNDIAALALRASQDIKTDIPFAILPPGHSVKSLEDLIEDKTQVKQRIRAQTSNSLVAYVSRFKDDRTVIFADIQKTLFHAVIDYHGNSLTPNKASHDVIYDCPLSAEWKTIIGFNKKTMDQMEFAELLEGNINLIAPVSEAYSGPSGTELLEMVLAFQETRKSEFKSVRRLQDGTFQMAFSDEKSGSGNTKLPEKICLAISPFQNGNPYQLEARIRYRLNDGRLVLWYELIEPEKIIEHAFMEILTDLQEQLEDVPVYEGFI